MSREILFSLILDWLPMGYLDFDRLHVVNDNLTYYQQSKTSISSKYKNFPFGGLGTHSS